MATKRPPRKRKDTGDITKDFAEVYKKNFDCSNIKLNKMFPLTDNHTAFYYLSQHEKTNMIFLSGPAGSMKSYLAVYTGLELLKDRKIDKIIYIRTVVESSSRSMGFLKGDENEKFSVYMAPFLQKANEVLDPQTVQSLVDQEYVKAMPVNFARGLTFNNALVIFDEAQNATKSELTTILTRFGRNSKFILLGDTKQADIKDSGFAPVFDLFDTEFSRKNNILCMNFDIHDIMRSPILRHITQVLGV